VQKDDHLIYILVLARDPSGSATRIVRGTCHGDAELLSTWRAGGKLRFGRQGQRKARFSSFTMEHQVRGCPSSRG